MITLSSYIKTIINETILSEKYVSGKKINDFSLNIGDVTIKYDIKFTKVNNKNSVLVDFYQLNDNTGRKDYSQLDSTSDLKNTLERISMILSGAYDSAIIGLFERNNRNRAFDKTEEFNSVAFYPARSEKDNKLNISSNQETQRMKLYVRFLNSVFGNSSFNIKDNGDLIVMEFNNFILNVGSSNFKQEVIDNLPFSNEIISEYSL